MKRCIGMALVLGGLALEPVAAFAADEPVVLRYEIRKDGEAIGTETVRIATTGADTEVAVENHTRTTVLFMDFAFDQERRELWRDGALRQLQVETNDDGTKSTLAANHGEAGWTVSVNGKAEQRPADSLPLVLWTDKVVAASSWFGTIDAVSYQARVEKLGDESVTIGGKPVMATHYRFSGEIERELWYGADGRLLKTTFKRKGFPIEFVRVTP